MRHSLLKKLQTEMPRGEPFDLESLRQLGISGQLAAKYVKSGWLVRLGQGVYAFPGEEVLLNGALRFLQDRVPGFHVGGRSALSLQGVRHYLGPRERLVVWGEQRFVLPDWFRSRFPARYVSARLFVPRESTLATRTMFTPPDVTHGVRVSIPERAVLELLHDAGTREDIADARDMFASLRSLRIDVVGELLSCCTNVKTVRLFLAWSRSTGIIDVDSLLGRWDLPSGSPHRWISRLKDGSILALKQHG